MIDSTPQAGSVLAICRVHQLITTPTGFGVTAIDKRAVTGPVSFRKLGVFGDVQCDRANHGGADQAVYAYSQEDADFWATELGRPIPAGLFGENLRTQRIETTEAVIGTRWRIGTALLEVTSPRTPCATFAERMDEAQWVKRFAQAGLVGCYLRVVEPGRAQAGDIITVEYVPTHGITVGKFFVNPTVDDVNALTALHESGQLDLAESYWKHFARVLQRQSQSSTSA